MNIMVFETIFEKVLTSYASQYLTGINSSNLSLGIWSGNIEI